MNTRVMILLGSLSGAIAIGLGAFGAHGLKKVLSAEDLTIFETGVRYQMYHALALVICGLLAGNLPKVNLGPPATGFTLGSIVFSGSLYFLVLTGPRWLGAITPIGGLLLIGSWLWLASAVWFGGR